MAIAVASEFVRVLSSAWIAEEAAQDVHPPEPRTVLTSDLAFSRPNTRESAASGAQGDCGGGGERSGYGNSVRQPWELLLQARGVREGDGAASGGQDVIWIRSPLTDTCPRSEAGAWAASGGTAMTRMQATMATLAFPSHRSGIHATTATGTTHMTSDAPAEMQSITFPSVAGKDSRSSTSRAEGRSANKSTIASMESVNEIALLRQRLAESKRQEDDCGGGCLGPHRGSQRRDRRSSSSASHFVDSVDDINVASQRRGGPEHAAALGSMGNPVDSIQPR